jgi:hypothetical protein
MAKLTTEKIGAIGESIAQQHLEATGFSLVRFGKANSREIRVYKTQSRLPLLPDYSIGCSYGDFNTKPECINTLQVDCDIPRWADLPYDEVRDFAQQCCTRKSCIIRDQDPPLAAYACNPQFLGKKPLKSETVSKTTADGLVVDGIMVVCPGNSPVGVCVDRMNRVAIAKYKNNVRSIRSFIIANVITTDYINRKAWKDDELFGGLGDNLPHDGFKIADAWQKRGPAAAEKLKEENRLVMEKKTNYARTISHPGRYDFVGFKDSHLHAIEVKVNSSTLSYWQCIRLGILKTLGFRILLVHIDIEENQLDNAMKQLPFAPTLINHIYDPPLGNCAIPAIEEIESVLNYRATHERARDQLPENIREMFFYD